MKPLSSAPLSLRNLISRWSGASPPVVSSTLSSTFASTIARPAAVDVLTIGFAATGSTRPSAVGRHSAGGSVEAIGPHGVSGDAAGEAAASGDAAGDASGEAQATVVES